MSLNILTFLFSVLVAGKSEQKKKKKIVNFGVKVNGCVFRVWVKVFLTVCGFSGPKQLKFNDGVRGYIFGIHYNTIYY